MDNIIKNQIDKIKHNSTLLTINFTLKYLAKIIKTYVLEQEFL